MWYHISLKHLKLCETQKLMFLAGEATMDERSKEIQRGQTLSEKKKAKRKNYPHSFYWQAMSVKCRVETLQQRKLNAEEHRELSLLCFKQTQYTLHHIYTASYHVIKQYIPVWAHCEYLADRSTAQLLSKLYHHLFSSSSSRHPATGKLQD